MPPSQTQSLFHARILCYLPEMRARASRLCRSSGDADDLVQHTVEKALRFASRLRTHSNPRAWLLRTLFNLFVDVRRQEVRLRSLTGAIQDGLTAPPPYEPCGWEMIGESDLWRAVDRLPAYQREVLHMTCREGRSYREISELLGVPPATVGTRLLRARQRARIVLQGPTATLPTPAEPTRAGGWAPTSAAGG